MTDTPFVISSHVRLERILHPYGPVSVSCSSWQDGVHFGRYPRPFKLGPRIIALSAQDTRDLLAAGTE